MLFNKYRKNEHFTVQTENKNVFPIFKLKSQKSQ